VKTNCGRSRNQLRYSKTTSSIRETGFCYLAELMAKKLEELWQIRFSF